MTGLRLRDDPDARRFTAHADGGVAVLEYRREGDRLRLVHTGVPEALEGKGVGSRLVRFALDQARERGLKVWPDCPFVAAYIRRHPEYLDLVDEAFPGRAGLERS